MKTAAPSRKGRKYEYVANTLRQRILDGEFRVGDSLPSIQELGKAFSLSAMTAHRGVQELVKEGFLTCNARSQGMIVTRSTVRRPVTETTLVYLLRHLLPRNEEDNFGLDMIAGVQREISQRGYRFIHHCLSEPDFEARVTDLALNRSISGVLLDDRTPLSAIRRLAALEAPCVLLNRWEPVPNLTCVAPDHQRVGMETVQLFRNRGYERVAFFYQPHDEEDWDERMQAVRMTLVQLRKGFLAAAQSLTSAGDRELIAEIVDPARYEEPEAYGLPRHKPDTWRPLGILASSDKWAVHIIRAIARTDLVIGRDIGVVGCFDLECGRLSERPPDTWTINRDEIGQMAAKSLIDRIENPEIPPGTITLPLQFVRRGTV